MTGNKTSVYNLKEENEIFNNEIFTGDPHTPSNLSTAVLNKLQESMEKTLLLFRLLLQ